MASSLDHELAFDQRGDGPPLVLLPGIGSRRQVWEPIRPTLEQSRRVFAVDLPGFGESPDPPPGVAPSVETMTGAVAAFLEHHGLIGAHVAGNSLGGAIALELARRGVVASATALAPIGFWSRAEVLYCVASLRLSRRTAREAAGVARALVGRARGRKVLFGQMFAHPERLSPAVALAELEAFAAGETFDRTLPNTRRYRFTRGDELKVPVTVAWGRKDRLLLPRQAERARHALPRATHVWVSDAGHVPMNDAPDVVAEVLLASSGGG